MSTDIPKYETAKCVYCQGTRLMYNITNKRTSKKNNMGFASDSEIHSIYNPTDHEIVKVKCIPCDGLGVVPVKNKTSKMRCML